MLFDKLFDYRGHELELADNDPLKLLGQDASAMFTYLVEVLRKEETFPNQNINRLMKLTWRLVGNNVVKFAYTSSPEMRTIHYYYERQAGQVIQAFMVPADFTQQCIDRRVFMMGGMIFNSSLMRDLWNERHKEAQSGFIKERAMAYEAEFYLTMGNREDFEPNDYQKHVMDTCPKGLTAKYQYQGRQFMDAA